MKHELYFRLIGSSGEPQFYAYAAVGDGFLTPIGPSECIASEINTVVVDEPTLLRAQQCVSACEHCTDSASITFDYLLDELTGCDPTITDYVMSHAAKCPGCLCDVTEKTLVVVG